MFGSFLTEEDRERKEEEEEKCHSRFSGALQYTLQIFLD